MAAESIEITGTPVERLMNGAKFGACMAVLLSLYVGALWLVRGDAPFERLGVTLPAVVAADFVGFSAAGATIGLIWPLRRSRPGAGLIAAVGAFLVYTAVGVTMFGALTRWDVAEWGTSAAIAAIWFLLGSTVLYRPPPEVIPPPPPSRLRTVRPRNRQDRA